MPSRKPHKKSRNGCRECKRRRVKCSETIPCSGCVKYRIHCSFISLLPASNGAQGSGADFSVQVPTSLAAASNNAASEQISAEARRPYILPPNERALKILSGSPTAPLTTYDYRTPDLELMHHYSSCTYATMSARENVQRAWGIAIPQEAYSNDYLMHGVLAVSALHLSYLHSVKKPHYMERSAFHLDIALRSLNTTIYNVTVENCTPAFSLSALVAIYVCASPAKTESGMLLTPIESIVDLFTAARGAAAILSCQHSSVTSSSLLPLIQAGYGEVAPSQKSGQSRISKMLKDVGLELNRLRELIDSQFLDAEEQEAYDISFEKLRDSFHNIRNAKLPLECGQAFVWPIGLSKQFIVFLRQHRPLALLLLSYYCAILHCFDDFWFLQGWSNQILNDIYMRLPPRRRRWLDWPKSVCAVNQADVVGNNSQHATPHITSDPWLREHNVNGSQDDTGVQEIFSDVLS